MSEAEITMGAGHADTIRSVPLRHAVKKLTMWLFIASDAVTFGAILFGYSYLRAGTPIGRPPLRTGVSSRRHHDPFVLLTSSLTMLAAMTAARQGRKSSSIQWLGATIVLGIIFAALTPP